uniref:Reverse transcriptase domain-containing protein n=1 Tax=Phytophthora ramorum TaxID=164328 RepID=H3GPJ3_PHYRM
MSLPVTSWKRFARDLHDGRIEQICILSDVERMTCEAEELNQLISEGADALSAKSKKERFDEQGWDSLKVSPFYKVLREYKDVLPDDIPAELPQDKGVQHEIDLVPGTKYCVTRQWPLPREQVKAIDDFFESRRNAGQVRESKSPHSAPTFCVKKPQGGWRIVHAYNKLNDATVPAQTPIPRKDVIIDSMTSSTIFSTLDLRDGFYQILMRESDIPLTAVSTPSGMLWEWLVMPQGLKNAPATFNRCVTHLLRSVRDFAPSYFDDVFIHSRAVNGKSDVEMHTEHLRKLLELMRKHKLYANLKKCIFGATEIPVLGCLVGKNGPPAPLAMRTSAELERMKIRQENMKRPIDERTEALARAFQQARDDSKPRARAFKRQEHHAIQRTFGIAPDTSDDDAGEETEVLSSGEAEKGGEESDYSNGEEAHGISDASHDDSSNGGKHEEKDLLDNQDAEEDEEENAGAADKDEVEEDKGKGPSDASADDNSEATLKFHQSRYRTKKSPSLSELLATFPTTFGSWQDFHEVFQAYQAKTYQHFPERTTTLVAVRNNQIKGAASRLKRH